MAPKKNSSGKPNSLFPPGWEWVQDLTGPIQEESISEANVQSSYLFGASNCERNSCRTNCKKNPSCHNGLGEKFWFGEIKDNFWVDIEDPEEQRKEKESHVGLKNLGATCYVNTLLQLWFHNLEFRNAIFKWVPPEGYQFSDTNEQLNEDSSMKEGETKGDSTDLPPMKNVPLPRFGSSLPDNICGNLQLLFALMKHSDKRFVDPTPFVQSLGLQTDEQQDAQEFSKLFMSLLEETLSNQESNVKRLVQDQFGGKYAYVTCCSKCGKCSKNESRFYELDLNIQGHQMLTECIKEFLKEEKLDGDNKYFCTKCQEKQNATRKIVLQSLPPVLNLQLLRFVFDRNTGCKSKCNSFLKFPDILDMNNFVTLDDQEDGIYELTAVLIHVGQSAYSGHYVAHILDKKDETWYRFNDEVVHKMKGKKLQLGVEDDPEGSGPSVKPTKRLKASKGLHCSKNSYMLVYTRKNDKVGNESESTNIDPPDEVLEHVVQDNSLLDAWINDVRIIMETSIQNGIQKQEEMKDIYENMQPKDGEQSEWIAADSLKKCFNEKLSEVPPINNAVLMCKHARLDPCKVQLSKRISTYAGDKLFQKFGGLPRLKSDSICLKCVLERARRLQFDDRLEDDKRFLTAALKNTENCCDGFWVGKASLKQWKQLAIDTLNFELSRADVAVANPSDSPQTELDPIMISTPHGEIAKTAEIPYSAVSKSSVTVVSSNQKKNEGKPDENSQRRTSSKRKLEELYIPNETRDRTAGSSSVSSLLKSCSVNISNEEKVRVLDKKTGEVRSSTIRELVKEFFKGATNENITRSNDVTGSVIGSVITNIGVKSASEEIAEISPMKNTVCCSSSKRKLAGAFVEGKTANDFVVTGHGSSSVIDPSVLKSTGVKSSIGLPLNENGEPCSSSQDESRDTTAQGETNEQLVETGVVSDSMIDSSVLNLSGINTLLDESVTLSQKHRSDNICASKRKSDVTCSQINPKLAKTDDVIGNRISTVDCAKMNVNVTRELPKPLNGSAMNDSQSKAKLFNYDVTCLEHGNLTLDENKRRLVSREVWARLKYYFKDCPEFSADESGCVHCQSETAKKKERREFLKKFANDMKTALIDLYINRDKPKPNVQETFELYPVSRCTLDDWRQFIRYPKDPQYQMIENEDLICCHGKLNFNADDFINPRLDEEFTLLSKYEWETMSSFLSYDKEISLINVITSEENGNNMLTLTPECCEECRSRRLNEDMENEKQFYYSSIYVRKLTDEKEQPSYTDDVINLNSSASDYGIQEKSAKKKKYVQPMKGNRQSSRHRTQRGEYMFRVDSSQTLKEMKVQLLSTFSVLPIDQHLSFEDGTPLDQDDKTLGDLGVRPGSCLLLRVDEPSDKTPLIEDVKVNGERKLEEGFKGTGLCRTFPITKDF